MSSFKAITTLFGQEEPTIVADSESFLQECSKLELKTSNFKNIEKLPTNSIIFSFTNDAAKLTFDLAKNTIKKKIIFCATQVFEPTLDAALYSLRLLLESDFQKAIHTQRHVLNMLNSHNSFSLTGNDTEARITISPYAQPYALIAEDVENDFIQSVAEFFEVHYAHMNPKDASPFSLH